MRETSFQGNSLKTRVTLCTLIIFVLSIWSLALYASHLLRQDMQRLLGEQQLSTASIVAAEIDHELADRLEALEKLASGLDPTLLQRPSALQAHLEQLPVFQDLFNGGIAAMGRDGTVIADVPISTGRIGVNYMDVDVASARALNDGVASIGKPVLGKKLHAPLFVMVAPVRDGQSRVVGAVAGIINLGKPNFLDQLTNGGYGRTGGYVLNAPEHALVVTTTNKSRIMASLPAPGVHPMLDRYAHGYEGTDVFTDPLGDEVLASIKQVPVAHWYLAVTLPTAEVFAPVRAMQRNMLIAALLLTVLAGCVVRWILQRELAPLSSAATALGRWSELGSPAQPLPITRDDEIGQLIGGFNRLLGDLAQREYALRESEERYRALVEWSPEAAVVHRQGKLVYVNPVAVKLVGATSAAELIGTPILELVHPDYRALVAQRVQTAQTGGGSLPMANEKFLRLDGSVIDVEVQSTAIVYEGEPAVYVAVRDVTEQLAAQEKLRLAANVFSHAREGIVITNPGGVIVDVNDAFCRITGYSREEALGQNPRLLNSGRQGPEFYAAMWHDLTEHGHWRGEIWNRRKNGNNYAEMLTISAVRDTQGRTQQYVALFSDITALKAHQEQLEQTAHFDALTALPNRILLADRMQQAMLQAQRRNQPLAVVYLDLDGFKSVNDQHGHEAGDHLLIALAARMKQTLREGDTLARIGGDEFVVILLDLTDVASSVPMINRLLAAAAQPVSFGQAQLQVSASLGVTFFPQAEEITGDQLLRQADYAMYQAKLAGKNNYQVFDSAQDRSVRGHHTSLERIRLALARDEFVLHYQPQVNMRSGAVIGAEALIRWQHPERGLLAPAHFLPVIENHALAVEIGEWVIDTALSQVANWHASGLQIPVSVNVGARQLQQVDFVARLSAILKTHPEVQPRYLELEVLQTSALENIAQVSATLRACQQIEVLFALDDFGTGYSSLAYLKGLPVFQLKIDQGFVRGMLDDPDDLAILEGVISLANAFRREVIAEGVETVAHGAMLLQLGCDLAQGYGIARPMPGADIPRWAANWQPDPAWADLPPVSHDNLTLLFASAEHHAWIAALVAFLKGEREAPPVKNPQECRFGKWLLGQGQQRHEAQPAFRAIGPLHEQVHALAHELCELHASGRAAQALERVPELHALRDALLGQLTALVRANRRRGVH